jgi:hypothetical protein
MMLNTYIYVYTMWNLTHYKSHVIYINERISDVR